MVRSDVCNGQGVKNSLLIPYQPYMVPDDYPESAAIAAVNCSAPLDLVKDKKYS